MVGVPRSSYQPTNDRYIVEDVWEVGVRARFGKLGVAEREEMLRNASNWRKLTVQNIR